MRNPRWLSIALRSRSLWLSISLLLPFLALAGSVISSRSSGGADDLRASAPAENPCAKFHARELPAGQCAGGDKCPVSGIDLGAEADALTHARSSRAN